MSLVTVFESSTDDPSAIVRELHLKLSTSYSNFEIIIVDNGIRGDELLKLKDILGELSCIRILRLSRKFPFDTAIFAGLENAIGDYIVVYDCVQYAIPAITQIVKALSQSDVVQGVSRNTVVGGIRRRWRSLFYWYCRKFLGMDVPANATYLVGLSRTAANSLLSSSRHHKYLRQLMRHVGYPIRELDYSPVVSLKNPRSFWGDVTEGLEIITSYSIQPLRVVTITGVLVALLNLFYTAYVGIAYLTLGSVEKGWTSTNLQLGMMFFFLFVVLAVLSEYIGRLLAESRNEPAFFIREEINSSKLIADETRRNIV